MFVRKYVNILTTLIHIWSFTSGQCHIAIVSRSYCMHPVLAVLVLGPSVSNIFNIQYTRYELCQNSDTLACMAVCIVDVKLWPSRSCFGCWSPSTLTQLIQPIISQMIVQNNKARKRYRYMTVPLGHAEESNAFSTTTEYNVLISWEKFMAYELRMHPKTDK